MQTYDHISIYSCDKPSKALIIPQKQKKDENSEPQKVKFSDFDNLAVKPWKVPKNHCRLVKVPMVYCQNQEKVFWLMKSF
jgi:hypothetical protein